MHSLYFLNDQSTQYKIHTKTQGIICEVRKAANML